MNLLHCQRLGLYDEIRPKPVVLVYPLRTHDLASGRVFETGETMLDVKAKGGWRGNRFARADELIH